jgi:thiol-disulfide isomerase/thioredoxin
VKTPVALGLVVLLALAACQKAEPPVAAQDGAAAGSAASHSVGHVEGIAWFKGDLDAAFAAAAAEHKPVFLYWGAEWCPPCHDLKAHVFSRSDFQDKLRQFIPVYLDGDAPGAQRAGEQFRVMGYPTAVVLTADHKEIARIAGGQDLGSYADVLDLALENVQPIGEVLAGLKNDSTRSLSAADCRRLAWNGWGLDPDEDPVALVDALERAEARCPAESQAERDRLVVTIADLAAGNRREAIEKGQAPGKLTAQVEAVRKLLADPPRALAAGDALLSLGEDFFVVARKLAPNRAAELEQQYSQLLDVIEKDKNFSDTERLSTAAARLEAARALSADDKVPEAVATRARGTLDAFLGRQYQPDARAGIINSASWVLTYLGDDARLQSLLEAEIKTSRTPYYYYPDIGDLEEKKGNKVKALEWFERGYRESRGPATRFQWGATYINALLRISPEDEPRIRTAVLDVLGELEGPDRIHARARSRLDRLSTAFGKWAKETKHKDTMAAVGERWKQICSALPESDPVRAQCPSLIGSAST